MSTGVVLLCRYSSSRLPGKIMKEIGGRRIIDQIVERILSVVDKDHFIVATSEEASDDIIADYCEKNGLNCYRGSLANVAKRFIDAATSRSWDYAVRINGDNFFVETNVLRHLINLAETGNYDFLSNTHNKTFPQGMSVEVVNTAFFHKEYENFSKEEDFEHVTYYLHHHVRDRYFFYDNNTVPGAGQLKFAIDEQKDFDLCKKISEQFTRSHLYYNMAEIVSIYQKLKHE